MLSFSRFAEGRAAGSQGAGRPPGAIVGERSRAFRSVPSGLTEERFAEALEARADAAVDHAVADLGDHAADERRVLVVGHHHLAAGGLLDLGAELGEVLVRQRAGA